MNARRWTAVVAVLAAVGLVIAGVLVWGDDEDDVVGSGPATSSSSTSATTSTSSSTTTTSTTSTPLPLAVSGVRAGSGGGSGEVALDWDAAEGATGYRVLRSSAPEGQFAVVATVDVTTGLATAGEEVVNIWSESHSYIPSDGPLTAPDPSPQLHYVEIANGRRCFKVVAYNEGGDAPPSIVACGSPP